MLEPTAFATAFSANTVCESPPPLTNFNGASYMGTWYEISRVPYLPFQPASATCTEAQYSNLNASTGSFTVYNTAQSSTYSSRHGSTGSGSCPNSNGWCYVHFGGPQPTKPNYQVVSTDYTLLHRLRMHIGSAPSQPLVLVQNSYGKQHLHPEHEQYRGCRSAHVRLQHYGGGLPGIQVLLCKIRPGVAASVKFKNLIGTSSVTSTNLVLLHLRQN